MFQFPEPDEANRQATFSQRIHVVLAMWLFTAWACIAMPLTNALEASDPPRPGDIVFRADFDTPESRAAWSQAPFASWEGGYQGTTGLRITVPVDQANGASMIRVPLDLRRYRGCRLLFECMAKPDQISQPAATGECIGWPRVSSQRS